MLSRLARYAITQLKGLYHTQLSERDEEEMAAQAGAATGPSILRSSASRKKGRGRVRRNLYDSSKLEPHHEGTYRVMTWCWSTVT